MNNVIVRRQLIERLAAAFFYHSVKAIGDTVTLGTSGIVRLYCGKNSSTITVVIGGQAVTGSNLAIDITKQ